MSGATIEREAFTRLCDPRLELGAGEAPAAPFLMELALGLNPVRAELSLGPGARAKLAIRVDAAPGADGVLESDIRVRLAEGARLELSLFSALPSGISRRASCAASIGEGASLSWAEACLDACAGSYRLESVLGGGGASFDFYGAYAAASGADREHALVDIHEGPGSSSRLTLRSALAGASRLRFQGLIHVMPGASGTDAYLSSRNLVLDDGARAESLPQLRIENDDVACSHGATTGGLREEEIFYLMSRGIERAEARGMLALGHLGAALDKLQGPFAKEAEAIAATIISGRAA
jgi:Fe-S cluster assembly protein SufD